MYSTPRCYREVRPDLDCGGLVPGVGLAVAGMTQGFPFLSEPMLDVFHPHSHLACKSIICGDGSVNCETYLIKIKSVLRICLDKFVV